MSLSSINLDAFHACARAGHFTRAADSLGITQSALSQRISKLEQELGTTLIVRDPAGFRLTPAGQHLLGYCQARLALEGEAIDRILGGSSEKLSGVIRIGGFSSVMRSVVLPLLAPTLREFPDIQLQVVSREIEELPKLLKHGEIDYMIHYQEFQKDEWESFQIGTEDNVLVEKKGYDGPNLYLDHDETDTVTETYLRKIKRDKRRYKRRYLDDVYGLIDGVKMGLGRAVIPWHLVHADRSLNILNPGKSLKIPVFLTHFRQPYYTSLHHQVVQSLKNADEFLQHR